MKKLEKWQEEVLEEESKLKEIRKHLEEIERLTEELENDPEFRWLRDFCGRGKYDE